MDFSNIEVVHEGRCGYLEYHGYRYPIEHINAGHFCIHFPAGHRHAHLQQHLDVLTSYAESKEPKWSVENRSRKYK